MGISVAVLGDLNWDLILTVPRLPKRGGEALSTSFVLQLGGSATNTARWLARLGFDVRLFAGVGTDQLGDLALAELVKDRVSTRFIKRYSQSTGLCCVLVDPQGERTLLTSRGANALLSPPLPDGWLAGVDWLHISGYALLEAGSRAAAAEAVAMARTRGIPVSADPGMVAVHGHQESLRELGPFDVFLPNREEAMALVGGEIFEHRLAELGKYGKRVFLKLGKEGCIVCEGGKAERIPAIPVEVRNSLGAGDAFNAGVIAGSLWGGSSLAQGALGNLLGALASGEISPTAEDMLRLIQTLPAKIKLELEKLLATHWP